jgi:hypothetical protein
LFSVMPVVHGSNVRTAASNASRNTACATPSSKSRRSTTAPLGATRWRRLSADRSALERDLRLAPEVAERRLEQDQRLSHIGEREMLEAIGQTPELCDRAARPASTVASVVS